MHCTLHRHSTSAPQNHSRAPVRRGHATCRVRPPLPHRPHSPAPGTMVWEAHLSMMKKTAMSTHVNLRHMLAEFV